jgi:outer membrane protein insertion porin family
MSVFFKLRRNNYFQNLNIFLFIITLLFSFSILPNKAHTQEILVSSIIVDGNKRISSDTIISLSKVRIGSAYSPSQLNSALQSIKKSSYFKSVDISLVSNVLNINIIENPTINSISFEGNKSINDINLNELVTSKQRQSLLISQVEKDTDKIATAYADTGRISAIVKPKVIELSDNRVDLVFEITEGRITEVEKITFTGNRVFSDLRLKGVIATKQAGLFRRFIKSDTYVKDKLDYDIDLLQNFYINKGFIDFEVQSSVGLTREKDAFLINYNIKEGQQYSFSEIRFDTTKINIDEKSLIQINRIKNGSKYDSRRITKLIDQIDIYLVKNGFRFFEPVPVVSRDDENLTMDVEIQINETKKVFVERIEVEGNSTTLDEVIRLQFDFVEGDPFNRRKILEAVDKIRGLGFFSNVETSTREGSAPEKIIIEVKLTEKPTGSLGIGAGYNSSDGTVATFNINERNFLGKGQTVKLDLSTSKIEKQTAIGFEDPSFLGRNLFAGIRFGQTTLTPSSVSLKTDNLYFAPKIGFPLSRDSNISIEYSFDKEDVKTSVALGLLSPVIRGDLGKKNKSALTFNYNLDKTNSVVTPTSGYEFDIKQEFNGLGGDISYSKSQLGFKTYRTILRDDIILSSSLSSGMIIGSDANLMNRFTLGGDLLKGFRNQGIGPYDKTYTTHLGGKMFTSISLEASFPIGIPEEYGIFGGLFLDTGSLWGLDNTDALRIDDSSEIRSALGFSIFWESAIGPLRFNWSRPIKKEIYDVTENFRFTIDTRF